MDSERLCKSTSNVINQGEALLLLAFRLIVLIIFGLFCNFCILSVSHCFVSVGALKRPEKECRQPSVLFQCPSRAVPRFGFRCAQNLFERCATYDFPNISKISALVGFFRFRISAQWNSPLFC